MKKSVIGRKLLLVEDDTQLAQTIRAYFEARENVVRVTAQVTEAQKLLQLERFDAVVLDLLLPDGDGLDIFGGKNLLPPIVILSTLSDEQKMIEGFSLGAMDYVVKPCSPELLETRLALRMLPAEDSEITASGIYINSNTRLVKYLGQSLNMTSSEFNILWFLMSHAGKYFDADTIYENIWEAPSLKQASIRYHVSNLRRKIYEMTGKNLIVTEFGKGYTFSKED